MSESVEGCLNFISLKDEEKRENDYNKISIEAFIGEKMFIGNCPPRVP